ncbi:MAG: acyltransferase [Flavobacteriales bacterium]|nr:acyltransferase [Flavobacteriales bacterium]
MESAVEQNGFVKENEGVLPSSKAHLESVDILRALAIISVFAFHSQEVLLSSYYVKVVRDTWFWFPHEGGWKRIFWSLSPSTFGWFGVELFLLLSGFLIHHNTLKKDLPVNWMDFLSKRFWRIYPAYFLAILVFGFAMGPFSALDWVLHLLLIHNLYEPTFFGINGSFWSLALEAQLYLVYPVLLLMRGRWGMGRTTLIIAGLSLVTLLVQQWVGPFGSSFKVSIARLWITETEGYVEDGLPNVLVGGGFELQLLSLSSTFPTIHLRVVALRRNFRWAVVGVRVRFCVHRAMLIWHLCIHRTPFHSNRSTASPSLLYQTPLI